MTQKNMSEIHRKKPLRLLSLFSGCGGMDLGFEGDFWVHRDSVPDAYINKSGFEKPGGDFVRCKANSFEIVFANDIVEDAKTIWHSFFSKRLQHEHHYHLGSIVDLVKQHKEGSLIFPNRIDIVTGGFPCQDFSLAGKRKGFDSSKDHKGKRIDIDNPSIETRGSLYMWMKEVIEITKPKMFIAENVKGLVNLSNVKDIIQNDFSQTGDHDYHVFDPMVLQAADYGVPQSRERVFFVGIRKSALHKGMISKLTKPSPEEKFLPFPKSTHSYSQKNITLLPPVVLWQIFEKLPEPQDSDDPSHQFFSKAKFMGKHCQGQTEINLSGVAPTIRSEHHGNIEFRRLSSEHGGKYTKELQAENKAERRLTPRECGLIQTFPPDFPFILPGKGKRFLVSPSAAYKMIGNAVPPLLAYNLARRIESLWDVYFDESAR
jgi:DNA (cytosine-5)-methyltransferase 1